MSKIQCSEFRKMVSKLDLDELSSVCDLPKVMTEKRLLGCFGNNCITNKDKTGQVELINITSDLLLEITCLLNFSE